MPLDVFCQLPQAMARNILQRPSLHAPTAQEVSTAAYASNQQILPIGTDASGTCLGSWHIQQATIDSSSIIPLNEAHLGFKLVHIGWQQQQQRVCPPCTLANTDKSLHAWCAIQPRSIQHFVFNRTLLTLCVHVCRYAFTVHGMWPQRRDGSWPEFCDPSSHLHVDELDDIVDKMEAAWPSWSSSDEVRGRGVITLPSLAVCAIVHKQHFEVCQFFSRGQHCQTLQGGEQGPALYQGDTL